MPHQRGAAAGHDAFQDVVGQVAVIGHPGETTPPQEHVEPSIR